mmetsp:Transcript_41190/g.131820  ORF Transcript_41190/g.131820 Transcript_41190/m.131820 type:complete len:214 (-) Transcript_41190:259-900(-)
MLVTARRSAGRRGVTVAAPAREWPATPPPAKCLARASDSSTRAEWEVATALGAKSSVNATRRSDCRAGSRVGAAKPCPPPDDMPIDATIGRPLNARPLVRNASWTASGLLMTIQGSPEGWSCTDMTSPCTSASWRSRSWGWAPMPVAFPIPTSRRLPMNGRLRGPGGAESAAGAATDTTCNATRDLAPAWMWNGWGSRARAGHVVVTGCRMPR